MAKKALAFTGKLGLFECFSEGSRTIVQREQERELALALLQQEQRV